MSETSIDIPDERPAGQLVAGQTHEILVRRFGPWTIATHAVLALSVFGLVFTGMPLKFSTAFWAWPLIHVWGGPHMAGLFHRGFAVLFFVSALMHVTGLVGAAVKRRFPPVIGPDSIVPRLEDVKQLRQDIRYLQGNAERPDFGRFTYMEKFDYMAEIWGIIVIGGSGLIMWFPVKAAGYLPGWVVNAALIFHSYEALLAAAFIFSIHFFNTHLRPEVFPVDEVIFSGVVPLHELEENHPGWYRRMRDSGKLAARYVDEAAVSHKLASRISVVFLTLGVVMLILIMWAAISQVVGFIIELFK